MLLQYEREGNNRYVTLWIPLILGVEVVHIICNIGTGDLPDMFPLNPWICSPRALGII